MDLAGRMSHIRGTGGAAGGRMAVPRTKCFIIILPLLSAAMTAGMLVARAQAMPGNLDELGCRIERSTGRYHCYKPPLAGRNYANKQNALKELQEKRAAPTRPASKSTTPQNKPATQKKKSPAADAPVVEEPLPPPQTAKTGQIAKPAMAKGAERPAMPQAAHPSEWVRVTNDGDAQYFVDRANLTTHGRTVTARTLTRYEAPRSSTALVEPYRSTVSIERYDCGAGTYALTHISYHAGADGVGKALDTVAVPESSLSYLTPTADTVNDRLLDHVCSGKARAKR